MRTTAAAAGAGRELRGAAFPGVGEKAAAVAVRVRHRERKRMAGC